MNSETAKKVIIVTVFHSLVSKNILNTEALTLLRDSGKYTIILLVPKIKKTFFETHYAHQNIVIEAVDMQKFSSGMAENFLQNVARLLINTHYLHYKRKELLESESNLLGRIKYWVRECFVALCADSTFCISIYRTVDNLISRQSIFEKVFETYKPDLVFSTDMFEQFGYQLLRESFKRKIPTVGMVRSWDNCLSKGLLRVIPETVLVNNDVLKEELISVHGVDFRTITPVGLPQFDQFKRSNLMDRDTFFKKNNLDPSKKIVMFAPGGNVLSDTDGDICDILIQARTKGLLPDTVQFFIRNHPHHPADLDVFKEVPGVIVQLPGVMMSRANHKETELTPDDQDFLRNMLAHTDLLIWVATSLCLDALVYDIPQVVVNFDGYKNKDYYHSVKRYHDEGHMKKMFTLKPFQVANNSEELIKYSSMYLHDKNVDSEEREAARKQQFYRDDGRSGERIAKILGTLLNQGSVV